MLALGEPTLAPEVVLWLWWSGAGLVSLLPDLDDSDPGFRLPGKLLVSRELDGMDTGSW